MTRPPRNNTRDASSTVARHVQVKRLPGSRARSGFPYVVRPTLFGEHSGEPLHEIDDAIRRLISSAKHVAGPHDIAAIPTGSKDPRRGKEIRSTVTRRVNSHPLGHCQRNIVDQLLAN